MSTTNDQPASHPRPRVPILLCRVAVWAAIFGIVAASESTKAGLITAAIMAEISAMTSAFGPRRETLSLAAGAKFDDRTTDLSL